MKPLRLEILFGSQDKLSPALKMITGSSKSSALALKKTRDELKNLENQQKQIDGFKKQKYAIVESTNALKGMQNELADLKQEMAHSNTQRISTYLNQYKKGLSETTSEIKKLTNQQKSIDSFFSQKKSIIEAEKSYESLKSKIKLLKQEMQNGSSTKLNKDFASTTKQAELLKNKITEQKISLQSTRNTLQETGTSTSGLAKTYSQLRGQIERLTTTQSKQITSIERLKQEYDQEKRALDHLSNQFNSTEKDAKKMGQTLSEQKQKLQELRKDLNASGISTHSLADQQRDLTRKITSTNESIDNQKSKLKNLNQIQQSHTKFRENTRTAALYGATATGAGVATMYSMRKPIDENKKVEIEQNRMASLGLGKDATKEATDYAKSMKTFGTSTLENMTLVRDGMTAFADVHEAKIAAPMLAKMKFANEAMYGGEQGADNEKKFMDMLKVIEMRNGLKSEGAFKEQANMIQQVITATGGRVQPEEWLNLIKTGGIAAKGVDNKSFYHTLEPLVQEMGGFRVGTALMSSYANLYQGRTTKRAARNLENFDLIGDRSKVHNDRTGNLSYLDIGAIKGADLFKKDQFAWMEKVLIPALNKKGITEEGDIVDAIGSIFSNRTASHLMATMYQQRGNIHKNMKLNAGADNIDQLSDKAQNTTTGKEIDARAKLHDAYLQFGQTILPIYTKALTFATNELQVFTTWMQKNPTLAKALGIGLVGLAAALVTIGGALVVFSPLLMGLMSLRLIMTSVGATGSVLGFAFKMLLSPFKLLGGAIVWLGEIFKAAGVFLLENPIILAITAIAVAAYLIYRNWAPIKSFFSDIWNSISIWASETWQSITTSASQTWTSITGFFSGIGDWFSQQWQSVSNTSNNVWLSISNGASQAWNTVTNVFLPIGTWFGDRWNDIKTAFNGGILGVSSLILNWSPMGLFYSVFAKVLSWFGIDLPSQFTGFGSMIIDGLINGIQSKFPSLKSIWNGISDYMPDWLKKRMDIHSPSRVMAGLGGYIVSGLGVGIDGGTPELKDKFNNALNIFQQRPEFGKNNPLSEQLDPIHQINLNRSANFLDPISSIESIVTKVRNTGAPTSQAVQAIPQQAAGNTYHVTFEMKGQQTPQELFNEFQAWIQRKERKSQAAQRNRFLDDY